MDQENKTSNHLPTDCNKHTDFITYRSCNNYDVTKLHNIGISLGYEFSDENKKITKLTKIIQDSDSDQTVKLYIEFTTTYIPFAKYLVSCYVVPPKIISQISDVELISKSVQTVNSDTEKLITLINSVE